MVDIKYVEGRLADLAEMLERSRRTTLETIDCLSATLDEEGDAVAEAAANVESICEEIEESHHAALEILHSFSEQEEEE